MLLRIIITCINIRFIKFSAMVLSMQPIRLPQLLLAGRFGLLSMLVLSMLVLSMPAVAAQVNVYSYREPQLIEPMFAQFTAQTGISVNSVFAKKGMLERLKSERRNSPADLVLTVDIGRLNDIKNAGLTRAVNSEVINRNIPQNLRDPENHWFGITARARIIVASKARVATAEIQSYEELADARFNNRVCSRSGKHAYNIALVAMMMSHHGKAAAEKWLAGVRRNLARQPEGNDRGQVKAIKQGVCDVAVINHYYLFQMFADPEQKPWHDAVRVIFPNQHNRGTHMNISGMAMTKHAPNADNARKLMEFLSGETAQAMYAEINGEYPANPKVSVSGYLAALGRFKQDTLGLAEVASNRAEASKMIDRVGYND